MNYPQYIVMKFQSEFFSLINLGSVGDVQILSPNLALNGTATQISDFHHDQFPDPDYAFYAINGDFATEILASEARCAITLNNMAGAWWQVDLKTIHWIRKMAITTRYVAGNCLFVIN